MNDDANRAAASRHIRKHQLVYPDERAVCFLAKNYADQKANARRRALDIGCGSGRHVRLLLDYGFQAYGIDYSDDAVAVAHEFLRAHPMLRDLKGADLADGAYPDGFFDLVLCWGVIFLRPWSEMLRDLKIIHRLLAPGGGLLVNFRARDSWFYGLGTRLEEQDTYALDERAGPYCGMRYTFLDEAPARDLLQQAGFQVENSERVELWKARCTERHTWWVFWARKPAV